MTRITINKCKDTNAAGHALERAQAITDAIRRRAFDLSQSRDGNGGSDVEDWLRAERDTVCSPASELVDNDKEFQARVALPGFEAKDIEVSALPDALVIWAEVTHKHGGKNGSVLFCEFSEKQLFRRLALPAPIDDDKVSASVENGVLQVTAPKTTAQPITAVAKD